jgi:hypothetical protein
LAAERENWRGAMCISEKTCDTSNRENFPTSGAILAGRIFLISRIHSIS